MKNLINKTITVKGDRGYGSHKVKVLKRRKDLESFYNEMCPETEIIFEVKMKDGSTEYITQPDNGEIDENGFELDPFIKEDEITG